MVGIATAGEIFRKAGCSLRQHLGVPVVPGGDELVVEVLAALLHVGALKGILDNIEEKSVVENLEIFPVTDASRVLPEGFVAPEQPAFLDRCPISEMRKQVHAVRGISRVW